MTLYGFNVYICVCIYVWMCGCVLCACEMENCLNFPQQSHRGKESNPVLQVWSLSPVSVPLPMGNTC